VPYILMCLLALVAGMKYIHLHNGLVQVNGMKYIQYFNGRSNKNTQKMKDVTRQHTH
jgi:hypothetical protein